MVVRGLMGWGRLTIASVAGLLVVGAPALAADKTADQSAVESRFDVAFGVTATSDYISRGYTQSDGPAIQPWVELDYGMFYAGYWGSNVSPALLSGASWEHDLSIGLRPEVGRSPSISATSDTSTTPETAAGSCTPRRASALPIR